MPVDLRPRPEDEAFRAEVRAFLETAAADAPSGDLTPENRPRLIAWQKRLIARGYAARTVPRAYGGYGAAPDPLKARIIREEFARAGAPAGLGGQGVSMLVPTLLRLGDEAQKRALIPPTLTGEMLWCQGYSEPGSGSDLASLRTTAREEGEEFVINGQKIWTSTAHVADMMFLLARTEPDAPRHGGLSYLLLSMRTPGITVRPLKTMTERAEFNEVFFDEVRTPRSQIVGARGQGWSVANATLGFERDMLGSPDAAEGRLAELTRLLQETRTGGAPLIEDPILLDRLMRLSARAMAMRCNALRLTTLGDKGEPPGLAGLVVKLAGCELNHQIAALALDALGEDGLLYGEGPRLVADGVWPQRHMFDLGLIIGGGTAQIQKNIIAERGLGMPHRCFTCPTP